MRRLIDAQSKFRLERKKIRSNSGAIANLLMLGTVPMVFGIAALAVDFAHGVLVRAQLQLACDAAAIAGAKDLVGCSGPLTESQISTAEGNAIAVGALNYTEQHSVSVTVDNPPPAYNPPPYTSTNCQYTVIASATTTMNTVFARVFGMKGQPISALSRAGVFPTSTATTAFGSLASMSVPLAVAIDVASDNDMFQRIALQTLRKGQPFKITTFGSTAGGPQNASWIECQQGLRLSPLSPLASAISLTDQFAAQPRPGIITHSNGDTFAYICGSGYNPNTNGNKGWLPYTVNEIIANGGSVNITVPLITVPNGNTDPNSMRVGNQMQIVGVATFSIVDTSQGPPPNLFGADSLFGTLVDALPLGSADLQNFQNFFGQFQGGNNTGFGRSTQGTPQIRLY